MKLVRPLCTCDCSVPFHYSNASNTSHVSYHSSQSLQSEGSLKVETREAEEQPLLLAPDAFTSPRSVSLFTVVIYVVSCRNVSVCDSIQLTGFFMDVLHHMYTTAKPGSNDSVRIRMTYLHMIICFL